jgi:hypothetical protein
VQFKVVLGPPVLSVVEVEERDARGSGIVAHLSVLSGEASRVHRCAVACVRGATGFGRFRDQGRTARRCDRKMNVAVVLVRDEGDGPGDDVGEPFSGGAAVLGQRLWLRERVELLDRAPPAREIDLPAVTVVERLNRPTLHAAEEPERLRHRPVSCAARLDPRRRALTGTRPSRRLRQLCVA